MNFKLTVTVIVNLDARNEAAADDAAFALKEAIEHRCFGEGFTDDETECDSWSVQSNVEGETK